MYIHMYIHGALFGQKFTYFLWTIICETYNVSAHQLYVLVTYSCDVGGSGFLQNNKSWSHEQNTPYGVSMFLDID